MKRLVLKFGGTSVGNIEKIQKVANIIKKRREENNEIIVVVSAMFGVTNDLKKNQIQLVKILIAKSWMYCFLQANRFQARFCQELL